MYNQYNSIKIEKVNLFSSVFSGRTDAIPRYYEFTSQDSGNLIKGYNPICDLQFKQECPKKSDPNNKTTCRICNLRKLTPLSDEMIKKHLFGKHILGIYPLLTDNTCNLIAADFDDHKGTRSPLADIKLFYEVCEFNEIPCYIELSKSGMGYHAWTFFDQALPAAVVRQIWFDLIEEADIPPSFDRLFPNQNNLTGKKLGNLIAMPFQGIETSNNKTLFMSPESDFTEPYPDQWEFLKFGIKRISLAELKETPFYPSETAQQTNVTPAPGQPFSMNTTGYEGILPSLSEGLDVDAIVGGLKYGDFRNDQLFRYACRLRAKGFERIEVELFVTAVWEKSDQTDFSQDEVKSVVDSAFSYPAEEKKKKFRMTELGFSERFVHDYGLDIRYCNDQETWHVWCDGVWQPDKTGRVFGMSKQLVRQISDEYLKQADEAAAKAESSGKANKTEINSLKAAAKAVESKRTIWNIVTLAQSEHLLDGPQVCISETDFDTHPMLLNVHNGVVDLKTGKLLPANRDLLMSKQCIADYHPDAVSPLWENGIKRIQPDPECRNYLQKLAGYLLTGDTSEQGFYIFWGEGANGKSVFVNTLRTIMAQYAVPVDFSTFTTKPASSIRSDLASLVGARFVPTAEGDGNSQIAEGLIKQAAGKDPLTVRNLYSKQFHFDVHFKTVIIANERPKIRTQDHGLWRKLILLPFPVVLDEADYDKYLDVKFLETETAGILNWCVKGCLRWQKEGLEPPDSIKQAGDQYKQESDVVGSFLAEITSDEAGESVPLKNLYADYRLYCDFYQEDRMGKHEFNRRIAKTYKKDRIKGRDSWIGIKIISSVVPN